MISNARTAFRERKEIIDKLNECIEVINASGLESGIIVSPIGLKDGTKVPNNGYDFGPDTPGTETCGIQEAINSIVNNEPNVLVGNVSISDDKISGKVILKRGIYYVKNSIILSQGIHLEGENRLSTSICLSENDINSQMDSIIKIPKNANECTINNITIIGRRDGEFQTKIIDGIKIEGYTWRVTLINLEIVNCQNNGINTNSSNDDANSINFEPIIFNVSIISCMYGMTLTYCADESIISVNIENCTTGLRYYGGNGKWFDVHIFNCELGAKIAGAPLRSVDMTLDTNVNPLEISEIDSGISPGRIDFICPIFVDNTNPVQIKSNFVRFISPSFIIKKITPTAYITSEKAYEIDFGNYDSTKYLGNPPTYLSKEKKYVEFEGSYITNVAKMSNCFTLELSINGLTVISKQIINPNASGYVTLVNSYFVANNKIYTFRVYTDNNGTTYGINIYDDTNTEVTSEFTVKFAFYD